MNNNAKVCLTAGAALLAAVVAGAATAKVDAAKA